MSDPLASAAAGAFLAGSRAACEAVRRNACAAPDRVAILDVDMLSAQPSLCAALLVSAAERSCASVPRVWLVVDAGDDGAQRAQRPATDAAAGSLLLLHACADAGWRVQLDALEALVRRVWRQARSLHMSARAWPALGAHLGLLLAVGEWASSADVRAAQRDLLRRAGGGGSGGRDARTVLLFPRHWLWHTPDAGETVKPLGVDPSMPGASLGAAAPACSLSMHALLASLPVVRPDPAALAALATPPAPEAPPPLDASLRLRRVSAAPVPSPESPPHGAPSLRLRRVSSASAPASPSTATAAALSSWVERLLAPLAAASGCCSGAVLDAAAGVLSHANAASQLVAERTFESVARDFCAASSLIAEAAIDNGVATRHFSHDADDLAARVHGGIAGGDKTAFSGLFLKTCVDTGSMYGGLERASKAATNEARACMYALRASLSLRDEELGSEHDAAHMLVLPAACVHYRGLGMLVTMRLPVRAGSVPRGGTLVYGSDDVGATVQRADAACSRLAERLAARLGLSEHVVADSGVALWLAGDVEGHRLGASVALPPAPGCRDGLRFSYALVDLARLMPPESPVRGLPGTVLSRQLRAELWAGDAGAAAIGPLSSDAFTYWGEHDAFAHNARVARASISLLTEAVPRAARRCSALLPRAAWRQLGAVTLAHACGVNCRLLPLVALQLGSRSLAVDQVLVQVAARTLKCEFRRLCASSSAEAREFVARLSPVCDASAWRAEWDDAFRAVFAYYEQAHDDMRLQLLAHQWDTRRVSLAARLLEHIGEDAAGDATMGMAAARALQSRGLAAALLVACANATGVRFDAASAQSLASSLLVAPAPLVPASGSAAAASRRAALGSPSAVLRLATLNGLVSALIDSAPPIVVAAVKPLNFDPFAPLHALAMLLPHGLCSEYCDDAWQPADLLALDSHLRALVHLHGPVAAPSVEAAADAQRRSPLAPCAATSEEAVLCLWLCAAAARLGTASVAPTLCLLEQRFGAACSSALSGAMDSDCAELMFAAWACCAAALSTPPGAHAPAPAQAAAVLESVCQLFACRLLQGQEAWLAARLLLPALAQREDQARLIDACLTHALSRVPLSTSHVDALAALAIARRSPAEALRAVALLGAMTDAVARREDAAPPAAANAPAPASLAELLCKGQMATVFAACERELGALVPEAVAGVCLPEFDVMLRIGDATSSRVLDASIRRLVTSLAEQALASTDGASAAAQCSAVLIEEDDDASLADVVRASRVHLEAHAVSAPLAESRVPIELLLAHGALQLVEADALGCEPRAADVRVLCHVEAQEALLAATGAVPRASGAVSAEPAVEHVAGAQLAPWAVEWSRTQAVLDWCDLLSLAVQQALVRDDCSDDSVPPSRRLLAMAATVLVALTRLLGALRAAASADADDDTAERAPRVLLSGAFAMHLDALLLLARVGARWTGVGAADAAARGGRHWHSAPGLRASSRWANVATRAALAAFSPTSSAEREATPRVSDRALARALEHALAEPHCGHSVTRRLILASAAVLLEPSPTTVDVIEQLARARLGHAEAAARDPIRSAAAPAIGGGGIAHWPIVLAAVARSCAEGGDAQVTEIVAGARAIAGAGAGAPASVALVTVRTRGGLSARTISSLLELPTSELAVSLHATVAAELATGAARDALLPDLIALRVSSRFVVLLARCPPDDAPAALWSVHGVAITLARRAVQDDAIASSVASSLVSLPLSSLPPGWGAHAASAVATLCTRLGHSVLWRNDGALLLRAALTRRGRGGATVLLTVDAGRGSVVLEAGVGLTDAPLDESIVCAVASMPSVRHASPRALVVRASTRIGDGTGVDAPEARLDASLDAVIARSDALRTWLALALSQRSLAECEATDCQLAALGCDAQAVRVQVMALGLRLVAPVGRRAASTTATELSWRQLALRADAADACTVLLDDGTGERAQFGPLTPPVATCSLRCSSAASARRVLAAAHWLVALYRGDPVAPYRGDPVAPLASLA